jgi:hypothetical protein
MAIVEQVDRVSAREREAVGVLTPRNVAAPGFAHTVRWAAVAGATSAEVQEANVFLAPAMVSETQQNVPYSNNGGWIVTIPQGKRVKALALGGLKRSGGNEITDSGGLADLRLAVSFPPVQGSGWDSPRFAVPPVSSEKMVPRTLTGASFSNRVLSFSDSVPTARVRVSLVNGGEPREFETQAADVSSIHLSTETAARNIKLLGPDGNTLWQLPEYDPEAPSNEVDIRNALELALKAKVQNNETLEATFTVSADAPAQAIVLFRRIAGALLRVKEGVVRTELTGDPVQLDLGGALADERPSSVTGDLTITYAGIRILESASDEPPEANAAVSGVIATASGVLKTFAPEALEGITPARVGIVGRAPEECELSLEFVSVNGGVAGSPVGPPAVLTLTPDNDIRTRWVEVPAGVTLSGALGLRVRANRGRFFWVTREQPLARIAIHDPNPGGRPLFIGASRLKDIVETNSHEPGASFPVAVFRTVAPALRSDLFLTVDISDLTLRYAR